MVQCVCVCDSFSTAAQAQARAHVDINYMCDRAAQIEYIVGAVRKFGTSCRAVEMFARVRRPWLIEYIGGNQLLSVSPSVHTHINALGVMH